MNYRLFKLRNTENNGRTPIGRVLYTDFRRNICLLSSGGTEKHVRIDTLVTEIMNGNFCITNPSILTNYRFDKYMKLPRLSINDTDKVNESVRTKVASMKGLLYHGSEGGIIGRPKYNVNKGLCDFGSGFYTGDNLNQAENRVSNRRDSIVYVYKYDLRKCRVYEFNNIVLWALFVGYNRSILSDIPNELLSKFEFINSHDVIIGYIADDKISAVYNDFLSSNITDVCLSECLKLVRYGKQVVFKTNHSLKYIELYSTYVLTKEMKKNSIDWGRSIKSNMEKDLEKYKLKYRRIGRYLDEILEET